MYARKARGFTLIELLAVVAILVLLLSLLVPALSTVREHGQRALCLSNIRQLQLAHTHYSGDHEGQMPGSETGSGGAKDWVSMRGFSSDAVETLRNGSLWNYLQNERAYLCPLHPFKHDASTGPLRGEYRAFRNYSINGYLNGRPASWGYPRSVVTMGQVSRPIETISFIEEPDPRKYLMGSWVTYMDPPRINRWVDPIAFWHNEGSNLAFVDGHAEYWRWVDARTLLVQYSFFVTQPNNEDMRRIKSHVAPGDPLFVINDLL